VSIEVTSGPFRIGTFFVVAEPLDTMSGRDDLTLEYVGSDMAKVGSSFHWHHRRSRSSDEIPQAFQELTRSAFVTVSHFDGFGRI
jgi:hypothetical protein